MDAIEKETKIACVLSLISLWYRIHHHKPHFILPGPALIHF